MPHFKDHFINECLKILKKEEVKNELKALMRPMIDMILIEIYPYILLSMLFVFISFPMYSKYCFKLTYRLI